MHLQNYYTSPAHFLKGSYRGPRWSRPFHHCQELKQLISIHREKDIMNLFLSTWKSNTCTSIRTSFAPSQNGWNWIAHLYLHFFVALIVHWGSVEVTMYLKSFVDVIWQRRAVLPAGSTLSPPRQWIGLLAPSWCRHLFIALPFQFLLLCPWKYHEWNGIPFGIHAFYQGEFVKCEIVSLCRSLSTFL